MVKNSTEQPRRNNWTTFAYMMDRWSRIQSYDLAIKLQGQCGSITLLRTSFGLRHWSFRPEWWSTMKYLQVNLLKLPDSGRSMTAMKRVRTAFSERVEDQTFRAHRKDVHLRLTLSLRQHLEQVMATIGTTPVTSMVGPFRTSLTSTVKAMLPILQLWIAWDLSKTTVHLRPLMVLVRTFLSKFRIHMQAISMQVANHHAVFLHTLTGTTTTRNTIRHNHLQTSIAALVHLTDLRLAGQDLTLTQFILRSSMITVKLTHGHTMMHLPLRHVPHIRPILR